MKRSEALNLIAEHIKSEFNPISEEGWDLSLCHAVTILDMLEDAGILPPAYRYWNSKNPEDVNERGIPKDLQHSIHNGDYLNEWEPE